MNMEVRKDALIGVKHEGRVDARIVKAKGRKSQEVAGPAEYKET